MVCVLVLPKVAGLKKFPSCTKRITLFFGTSEMASFTFTTNPEAIIIFLFKFNRSVDWMELKIGSQ